MGCCASVESGENGGGPYPDPNPNSSRRAINSSGRPSQTNLPRPSTNASTQSNRPRGGQSSQPPLSAHINRPLKLHVWTSNTRQWNRIELDRERTEYFDTRVTGRQEVWQTIRLALETLWAGGDAQDNAGGLATAQGILSAGAITLPTGDLVNGAYDTLGNYYALPEHIVADPTNLAEAPSPREVEDDGAKNGEGGGAESEGEDDDEILRRREQKGKAVMVEVIARLSDQSGPDVTVQVGKDDSVRLVTRKVFVAAGLSKPKKVRLMYMGGPLEGKPVEGKQADRDKPLSDTGYQEGHIMNAFVYG